MSEKQSYVVYNIGSTVEPEGVPRYQRWNAAKVRVDKMNKKAGRVEYAYTSAKRYYEQVVYKKKVRNMMSGLEVEIASNTPGYCDPSREAYWCK